MNKKKQSFNHSYVFLRSNYEHSPSPWTDCFYVSGNEGEIREPLHRGTSFNEATFKELHEIMNMFERCGTLMDSASGRFVLLLQQQKKSPTPDKS